ncbi:MAG: amino acid permease [Desulfatiglans sp.]|jgi:amino acid transporter|nr:amino acid permease [Thermodesulfobacteriota bacterium]MEE4354337.1 amino acid permease [Desulfatiglans sp.]
MTENHHQGQDAVNEYQGSLGTFSGVFTPSVLTILGIILFLRLGYVVGSAGLSRALIIIGLANAISILTSFSLAAIATNLKVKRGGDYYMISRTLGVEFGGAIGIVLFLAQSVSIAFYCIGFGEALTGILSRTTEAFPQIVAALAVALLFIFAWMGADWATRLQYVIMGCLAAALVSFFIGGLARWDSAVLVQNWAPNPSTPGFWVLFAIFFPAVTGFTQGVSMSGDLKDPGKSLPNGTFMAVGVSILIYFGAAIVFAAVLPGHVLIGDYGAMKEVAFVSFLVHIGVIAATLSSAMASFLGAPRILQSLAGDRIFPLLLPFAKGYGETGNPRRGVLLSAGIALATIALGRLNLIASLVSMFFLISYGLLNYATYYEARTSSPSFRPTFRWFDGRLSLLGFFACLGTMLAINLPAGAVAIGILFGIYQYLKRTSGPARWADSRRSYFLQRVRENLLSAALEPEHPRDWRPQILAFSNDSRRRGQLLQFASWLEGGSGVTSVVRILEGEGLKMLKLREEAESELKRDIETQGLTAFPLVVVAPKLHVAVQILVQGFGVGPLKANTILLNWRGELPKGILGLGEAKYGQNLRAAFRYGSNIIILHADEDEWAALEKRSSRDRSIDIWWRDDPTSHLMLLFAYLMTRDASWDGAKIRVLGPESESEEKDALENLGKTLQEVRIEAEPIVVKNISEEMIVRRSSEASMVFLPFSFKKNQVVSPMGVEIKDLVSKLPIVAMVLAAEDIDLDAEPEEGKLGERAAAVDTLVEAEKKARKMEKNAEKAEKTVEEKLHDVASSLASGSREDLEEKIKAASEAKAEAEKVARRAAKASAKAEDAALEAEKLGAHIEMKDKELEKESDDSD